MQNAPGDTVTVTIPGSVAGDTLILTIEATGFNAVPAVQSVTDNGSAHAGYARTVENQYDFPSIDAGIWYASNIPAGITQLTIHWNAGSVSVGSLSVWVGEYSGLAASGSLDKTAFHQSSGTTLHSTGTTAPTSASNELVVAL